MTRAPLPSYGIRELARVAHPIASRLKYLAMLIAYFDESGHPRDRAVVSMAGVVATEKKWKVFEDKWRKRLRREQVTGFRMSDYEHSRGAFVGWDDFRRTAFISDLAALVKNTLAFGAAGSIILEEWNATLDMDWEAPEKKRAIYGVLVMQCLQRIVKNVTLPKGEKIACVFEENDFIAGSIQHVFVEFKKIKFFENVLGTMVFAPKDEYIQLQAADMLAFEQYKDVLNQVDNKGKVPRRKLYNNLMQSGCIHSFYIDCKEYKNFLERNIR